MSNFRLRLRNAAQILCSHPGEIKFRLQEAITTELILANFPEDTEVPEYFRAKLRAIINEVSTKGWGNGVEGDHVRATLHGKHSKTLAKVATEIFELFNDFEYYLSSGFIPE